MGVSLTRLVCHDIVLYQPPDSGNKGAYLHLVRHASRNSKQGLSSRKVAILRHNNSVLSYPTRMTYGHAITPSQGESFPLILVPALIRTRHSRVLQGYSMYLITRTTVSWLCCVPICTRGVHIHHSKAHVETPVLSPISPHHPPMKSTTSCISLTSKP